jgi:hypothetical protein
MATRASDKVLAGGQGRSLSDIFVAVHQAGRSGVGGCLGADRGRAGQSPKRGQWHRPVDFNPEQFQWLKRGRVWTVENTEISEWLKMSEGRRG